MADPGFTDAGSTKHFVFEFDQKLEVKAAQTLCNALIANAERDYDTVASWFDGLTPAGVPFLVKVGPDLDQQGGSNDGKSGITIDHGATADFGLAQQTLVAEVIELFMPVQSRGWRASQSDGEGLSQLAAFTLYPDQAAKFDGVKVWMDAVGLGGVRRPDFVSVTENTDGNPFSYGCALLFLYYLHWQLGVSLHGIVQAAADTLEAVYSNLTQDRNGFAAFSQLVQSRFPLAVIPSVDDSRNFFPLPTSRVLSLKKFLARHPLGTQTLRQVVRAKAIGDMRALLNSDRMVSLVA